MPPDNNRDDLSTLERMRRGLYGTGTPMVDGIRPAPTKEQPKGEFVDTAWATTPPPLPPLKKKAPLTTVFFVLSAFFFVGALAFAAYFFMVGGRNVSAERIGLTVDAPIRTGSGDEMTLIFSIENRNPTPAINTEIRARFPESTRVPDNPAQQYTDYVDTAGDIQPGQTSTRSVRVVLYGAEGDRITIPVTFEYRIPGSNGTYERKVEHEVVITSSPLSVRAEAVSEVAIGQPITFAVTVRSNATAPIENVAILAQYPFGFAPTQGKGPLYEVGTLAPGEERIISITGVITGEDAEERVFRFGVGPAHPAAPNILTATYSTATVPVTLAKPFLATALTIGRDSGATPIIKAGADTQGMVSWINTLTVPLRDARVEVALSGSALDASSVSAHGGFYRSSDRTIIFSKESDLSLGNLAAGATGNGSFNFKTRSAQDLRGARNQSITAVISVSGRRVGEGNVSEAVNAALTRTLKIETDLTATARGLRSTGPFQNTGAWPPVVDQESTYTVELSLANSLNTVADAAVSGVLPSYVRFVGAASPNESAITYNATTRTVTWKAGEIEAGVGHGTAPRTAHFQVALLPSVSQRGTSPILLSGIRTSGFDRFTERQVESTHPDITARITTDPQYTEGKGEVR